jgi:hypothetical protein
MSPGELICPDCGREHDADGRFCDTCGMPLVHAGRAEHRPSPRQRRARKVKPQYSEGRLVKVAEARNEAQAEFLTGMLLEEGIPAVACRIPEVSMARDVFVPESGAEAAREALTWERPADAGLAQ